MKDVLIVGAGLYGATIARLLTENGVSCLVIDERDEIGGNCMDEKIKSKTSDEFYTMHMYGPHIFHTDNEDVWKFVNRFTKMRQYSQETYALVDNSKMVHLPFSMGTFYDLFGLTEPGEVYLKIKQEISKYGVENPSNLEEMAISLVGKTVYEKLIKHYTEKQWGRPCKELPADIITRLPVRLHYKSNYFNDEYVGIPENGYSAMIANMLEGIEVITGINHEYWLKDYAKYKLVVYCGAPDKLLEYKHGTLEWRSLKFKYDFYPFAPTTGSGLPILNYCDNTSATRRIDHIYFMPWKLDKMAKEEIEGVRTYEYPAAWKPGMEPYYPVNTKENEELYDSLKKKIIKKWPNLWLGGRLGKYKYYDMDDTIIEASKDAMMMICQLGSRQS